MDALTNQQLVITLIMTIVLTPFFSLLSLQMPDRLVAEYRNECIDFLRLKRRKKALPPRLPRPSSSKTLHRVLYYLPIVSYISMQGDKAQTIHPEQRLCMEVLSVTLVTTTLMQLGWSPAGFALSFFYLILVAIAFIDANSKLIPDALSVSGLWIGLLAATQQAIDTPLTTAIWGAVAGYLGPYIISKLVCLRNKRPDAMGYGDFKMLAMFGVWLGPLNTLNAIILSSGLFLCYYFFMQLAGRVSRHTLIPFGPFLSIAAWAICQSPLFLFSNYLR